MNKAISFIVLMLLFHASGYTQNFEWVSHASGSGSDSGERIVADDNGNVYITGHFQVKAKFDGQYYRGNGGYEIFVAKYDADGALLWIKTAGGVGYDEGLGIALDSAGNIYLTGYISATAYFGEIVTGDRQQITATGNNDVFIAKYDPTGLLIWVKKAGGTDKDRGHNIKVTDNGDCYITGYFTGQAFFGNQSLTSNGSEDIFLAKMGNKGNFIWARSFGGNGQDNSFGMALDTNENIHLTGFFYYTAEFSHSNNTMIASGTSKDGFIAKYNSQGGIIRARRIGGPFADAGFGIATDLEGNSYVTGYFLETAIFDNYLIEAVGYNDIYVAKFDTGGVCSWAISEGGLNLEIGMDIGLDENEEIYVTGFFENSALFGDSIYTTIDEDDIFIAKYNRKGILLWMQQAGGLGGDYSKGMHVSHDGTVYVTGYYFNSASFGNFAAGWGDEDDIFLTKLSSLNVGIPDILSANNGCRVYPNPNNGNFTIDIDLNFHGPAKIKIYNIYGQAIFEENPILKSGSAKFPVSFSPPQSGIYIISIHFGNERLNQRVVIF